MNQFKCAQCQSTYSLREIRWKCDCGSVLDIECEVQFRVDDWKNRFPTLWRYREAIPIDNEEAIVSFHEGFTPLLPFSVGNRQIYVKLEYLFPSGSFKDRGASVLVSKVKELGIQKVVIDSSGNAGCAVSTYCARAGIACDVYVPEHASPAKLKQIQTVGANVCTVPGPRDEAAKAVLKAAESEFYAGHTWNPFFYQGTKTIAFEVWEQLGYRAPDALLFPTGSGSFLIGAYLGFRDLHSLNLIEKLPRLIAVQTERCAPLYKMFHENLTEVPTVSPQKTIAEGIAVASPARAKQIVQYVRETNGTVVKVSEEEIRRCTQKLCRNGFFVEPTSAAAIAGLAQYDGPTQDVIVVPLTGHGLKSSV
ncbi:MAG: pyridoxal-phosphate dependent enzyme [Candidatus Omnitrophota bacterium]|jgi:threonine synthase|nr:MAG: pyridoxal-phosphate dependent enzyme [Candidatus Omnitrophota bacterium]